MKRNTMMVVSRDPLDAAGELYRAQAPPAIGRGQRAAFVHRLQFVDGRWRATRPASGVGRALIAAALGAAGLAGGWALYDVAAPPRLLTGSAGTSQRLAFSDGSRVDLEPGTQAGVSRGARGAPALTVERGVARVQAQPLRWRHWSVDAGPYRLTVAGARFRVAWAPEAGRLTVDVDAAPDASPVLVQGPRLGDGIRLGAGQRLDTGGAPAEMPKPVSASAVAVDTVPQRAAPAPVAIRRAARGSAGARASASWAELVARGEFGAVLAAARTRGVAAVLSSASASDLAAVADAARYQGDQALSEQALRAQRRRFPASERAAMAAFLLGRLKEGQRQDAAALASYNDYLAEAPHGSLIDEALGRRLVVTERALGRAAAVPLAHGYLAAHPAGAYAPLARKLAAQPPLPR